MVKQQHEVVERKKGIKSAADIRKLKEAEKIAASWHK
jgi:hypothetical protein